MKRLLADPLTPADLQMALAMLVVGILAGAFLRMRDQRYAISPMTAGGVAAFIGVWLCHHGRLTGLLGVKPGLWMIAVPGVLAALAAFGFADTKNRGLVTLACGAGWLVAVRVCYLAVGFYRGLRG